MKRTITHLLLLITAFTFTTATAQWSEINSTTGRNLYRIAFSGLNGVVAGANGLLLTTDDGGLTWNDSMYYPNDPMKSVAFVNVNRVVAGGNGYYVSVDGGNNFHSRYTVGNFGDFIDIVFVSATKGIAIDNNCYVATSNDAGENWTRNTEKPCSGIPAMSDIDFPSPAIGYFCGANGNVFKTTDTGSTWLPVTAPDASDVNYSGLQFLDPLVGFIAGHNTNGSDTVVFKKTVDGGASWIDLRMGLVAAGYPYHSTVPSFMFIDQTTGYAVGYNKIYKTTDGGQSWTVDFTSAGSNYYNRILITPTFALAVGAGGTMARLPIANTGIADIAQQVQLSVYPNPANDRISLAGFDGAHDNLLVEIIDLSGKTVLAEKTVNNQVSISSLSKGFYIGRTTDASGKQGVFKLVKE